MQEINLDDNKLGVAVFINEIPELSSIPNEVADRIVAALELQISDYYNNQE